MPGGKVETVFDMTPFVEQAIAAERERCAKIADKEIQRANENSKAFEAAGLKQGMYSANSAFHTASVIAEAIRNPEEQ